MEETSTRKRRRIGPEGRAAPVCTASESRQPRPKGSVSAKAILIHPQDNVATALVHLAAGQAVSVELGEWRDDVVLVSDVPRGHKFSLRELPMGAAVVKYGEPIGESTREIARGEHVHVHNVASRSKLSTGAVRRPGRNSGAARL